MMDVQQGGTDKMKKAVIFAAALMAGVSILGSSVMTQAASANVIAKKIVVNGGTVKDCQNNSGDNTIKDCLDKLVANQMGNCSIITIPCIPGLENGNICVPEIDKPDTETPEMPDVETPDIETPEDDEAESEYHAYVLRVVELVNEERAKAGLQPLTLIKEVTAAAQVRAIETVTAFSHTRPDGRHFTTALNEAGVSYRGAGENIAWGQRTPEQVMSGWMNSSGHRANILNARYTSIGVGYYQNANGTNYWSQLFTY